MKLKIITGLSGSGKTTALRIFEDLGYYCMDNVPGYLIENFIKANYKENNPIDKMAVVVDYRSREVDRNLEKSLLNLKNINDDTQIIFLFSSDESIMNRYNELRRPHPLGDYGDVKDGLDLEKKLLKSVKHIADNVIDTTNYGKKDLRKVLIDVSDNSDKFIINLYSFGYKYGLSTDFDLVFDMRFLPNPYYIDNLKKLTGCEKKLQDYLNKFEITETFTKKVVDLLEYLIPEYKKQEKNNLSLAFGCTGGQHRSVFMCEKMYKILNDKSYVVVKKHRDREKWKI